MTKKLKPVEEQRRRSDRSYDRRLNATLTALKDETSKDTYSVEVHGAICACMLAVAGATKSTALKFLRVATNHKS